MRKWSLKIKTIELQLFIILAMGMSYLYLIDDSISIAGISFEDIALILSFIWGIWWLFKLRFKPKSHYTYRLWVIGLFVLIVLSSIQSMRLNGQSVALGLRPQRRLMFWGFLYFPLTRVVECGKLGKEGIISIVKGLGLLSLVLFIGQYFLYGRIDFLHVNNVVQLTRGLRYYFMPTLLDLLFMIELDEFVKQKGSRKIPPAVIIGMILFEVAVVQKFRMTSLGLLICLAVFIFIEKSNSRNKIPYIFIGLIAIVFLINTDFFQNILNAVFSGNDATLSTRERGRLLYFSVLQQHPILGGGYPHGSNMNAVSMAGSNVGIYLVDNGLVGFLYIYGLVGAVWFVSLWIKLLKDGWRALNARQGAMHFLFPLYFIVTGLTEAHWYWEFGFLVFIVYLCIEESEKKEIKENKE